MKSRCSAFDHDLEYGRDIRIAGVVALASLTAAFLFLPQPQVQPYQSRIVPEWVTLRPDDVPIVLPAPEPPQVLPRGVPVAGDNPNAPTIAPNTTFNELMPDTIVPVLENVKFWKVERKPRLVNEVAPAYPEMARAAGIEGRVVVSMVVDTLGNVARAVVYSSSGNSLLDMAAVEAAYKCGFVPGLQRDRPVQVSEVVMTFNFRLQ